MHDQLHGSLTTSAAFCGEDQGIGTADGVWRQLMIPDIPKRRPSSKEDCSRGLEALVKLCTGLQLGLLMYEEYHEFSFIR